MSNTAINELVLILVLVEDGLRATTVFPKRIPEVVLILVLVEDGLRAASVVSLRHTKTES